MNTSLRNFRRLLAKRGLFGEDTWNTWWALLLGAFGEELSATERATYKRLTDREAGKAAFRVLAAFVGRRGGKNSAASIVVVFLALCGKWKLSPGEIGVVLGLALDREQAKVEFRYILGLLNAVPELAAEIESTTNDRIVLRNGIEIQVATSDYGSVRGRTVVAAVLDEFAFWPHEQAIEVLRALRPAMATQPKAMLIILTTIYAQRGPAYDLFRQWGKADAQQLVIRGTTRDFNPSVPEDFIAAEVERDPAGASAEYLTIPRSDVEGFIDGPLIDTATRTDPRELPYLASHTGGGPISYYVGIDVSGGRGDAAACAVSLVRADRPKDVIIAACRRWPAPHDPKVVAAEVAAFLKTYGLALGIADQYGAELSRSIYSDAGVTLSASPVTRSEAYLHMLPLLTTGRIEIPDEPVLRRELLGLERRTTRSGKDSVDHGPHGHDDLANAVALAAYAASRNTRAPFDIDAVHVGPLEIFDTYENHGVSWNSPKPWNL